MRAERVVERPYVKIAERFNLRSRVALIRGAESRGRPVWGPPWESGRTKAQTQMAAASVGESGQT